MLRQIQPNRVHLEGKPNQAFDRLRKWHTSYDRLHDAISKNAQKRIIAKLWLPSINIELYFWYPKYCLLCVAIIHNWCRSPCIQAVITWNSVNIPWLLACIWMSDEITSWVWDKNCWRQDDSSSDSILIPKMDLNPRSITWNHECWQPN